jgi:microcystin-dependent protein
MDDVFVGEIRPVGFGFVPNGWALCDGSLLQIRSFTALFNILGTTYGGDGRTTFGLPDLRGRAVVTAGQGPGISNYPLGLKAGTETETITLPQMPNHVHTYAGDVVTSSLPGTVASPVRNFLAKAPKAQYTDETGANSMAAGMISGTGTSVGGNQAHDNRQPYLGMYYVIALLGEFPQRP